MLHFFTGGCINCLHVLKELKRSELPEGIALVGIHTGKFAREKEDGWISELIARQGISHPVVNDADGGGGLWDGFAVRAWPTLVLVSPDGYEVARVSGEGRVTELIEAYDGRAGGDEAEATTVMPSEAGASGRAFSKIFADETHLYISDTGRNTVHICTLEGRIVETLEGFEEPQGLFAKDGRLYVADRAAGAVVVVDLETMEKKVLAKGLRSPWGVTGNDEGLQVAVAGAHQIWQVRYDGRGLGVMAGIGAEGIRDGKMRSDALFAQPTDLDWLDDVLYVVDAEGSALRAIENKEVKTPIGWDLFTYGDRDGIGEEVRIQHPEGLCAGIGGCGNHRIFLCDTYNDKVKVYDPLNGRVTTLIEGLHLPTGICKSGCFLYVTESGRDTIVRFDISSMQYERIEIE
ncbi:hypothetical protein HCR_19030 [Hydrogenimonas cancrithermarum]|uniref:NHL repeat protein n=1 Tax=Hydrogenimonas cancrithermarum TaxID=2993563 RepID=A0ABM8FP15_9BACT|nr:hypothetical protein HCR_19030 [Hydrogenimonas cancrithermarum]